MGEYTITPQLMRAYTGYEVKEGDMVYPVYNDELPDGSPRNLGQRYPAGILLRIGCTGAGPGACPYVAFHLFIDGQIEVYDEPYWSIHRVFRPEEDV
jgi:hypothetical protein